MVWSSLTCEVVIVDTWGSRCWRVRWSSWFHSGHVRRWRLLSLGCEVRVLKHHTCHKPITRQNGDGNITGRNFRTRPRPVTPRTRDPSWDAIPVTITSPLVVIMRRRAVVYMVGGVGCGVSWWRWAWWSCQWWLLSWSHVVVVVWWYMVVVVVAECGGGGGVVAVTAFAACGGCGYDCGCGVWLWLWSRRW